MTKDAFYFPHDSNAKDDPKCMLLIEQLGLEGYGIYWVLIETLRDQIGYRYPINLIPAIARRFNTTSEKVKAVIMSYGLFQVENEEFFYSKSLIRRMAKWDQKRNNNRLAGLKSAEKRGFLHQQTFNGCSTDVLPVFNHKEERREEKKREEERREEKKERVESDDSTTPLTEPEKKKYKEPEKDHKHNHFQKPTGPEQIITLFVEYHAQCSGMTSESVMNTETLLSWARRESEKFFDHYSANGWKQSNGLALKDLSATVRQWYRRGVERKNGGGIK